MTIHRRDLILFGSSGSALALLGCSPTPHAGFLPAESLAVWHKFLAFRGSSPQALSAYELVQAALNFFASEAASGLAPEPEADSLLYQWGVFGFGKGQDFFEFDITRQFIALDAGGTRRLSQLRCTAYFEPDLALRSIPQGNRWCKSKAELGEFKSYILGSKAFAAVESRTASKVLAAWSLV